MKKLNDLDLQTIYCRTLASVMNEVLTLQQLADDKDLPVFEDIFASLQCVGNPVESLGELPEEDESIELKVPTDSDVAYRLGARTYAMMDIWWHCAHTMVLTIYSNQGAHPIYSNMTTATALAGIVNYDENGELVANNFYNRDLGSYMNEYGCDDIKLVGDSMFEQLLDIEDVDLRLAVLIHIGYKALCAIAQNYTDMQVIMETHFESEDCYKELKTVLDDMECWPIACGVDEYSGYWTQALPYIQLDARYITYANKQWDEFACCNPWMR